MNDAGGEQMGDAVSFNQPQGGMFFWARLTGARGTDADANAFAKRAIDKLVAGAASSSEAGT